MRSIPTDPWTILRQNTAEAHRRLEELPRLSRMFADDYRREELAEMLATMLAIHRPLERALAAGCDLAAFGYQPRSPLLDADLVALDWAGTVAEVPFAPPPTADLGSCLLGIAYVIEGSMLGGQVIRKRLIEQFGRPILSACTFYSPYGEAAGEQWRRFREELDARLNHPDAITACAAAALFTFEHFERALAQS